ncbi:MAG: tail fiber protein [Gammaproteobacteria bacterium]
MEGYIGQIILFAGTFAPRNWAYCDGQLIAINTYQALFAILGTTYGGDGRTTFALPDLRGRAPIHEGQGPGLSLRQLGQAGGSETNTLTAANMPAHNHGGGSLRVSNQAGEETAPAAGNTLGGGAAIYNAETPGTTLNPGSIVINSEGGNQPVNNMQPWLAMNYIICMQGLFPSRS